MKSWGRIGEKTRRSKQKMMIRSNKTKKRESKAEKVRQKKTREKKYEETMSKNQINKRNEIERVSKIKI